MYILYIYKYVYIYIIHIYIYIYIYIIYIYIYIYIYIKSSVLGFRILGLKIREEHKSLPVIYWIPKLHYTPSQARVIIASSRCITEPISKVVSKLFKNIFNQISSFPQKSTFYKTYNSFWLVQNSKNEYYQQYKKSQRNFNI